MPADLSSDTFILELKPGPDPLKRQGINREPIYRLRRLLKLAARECGFRVKWGQITPAIELREPEREYGGIMIRFADGPAAEQLLMLRRAPLYMRVVFNTLKQEWDALDQLVDKPDPGDAIFVYRRVGEPSHAFIDWTEKGRRCGGCFASASYSYVAEQPDEAVVRNTEKWRDWCWAQVKKSPEPAPASSGPSAS
jgi:hypothetical protein